MTTQLAVTFDQADHARFAWKLKEETDGVDGTKVGELIIHLNDGLELYLEYEVHRTYEKELLTIVDGHEWWGWDCVSDDIDILYSGVTDSDGEKVENNLNIQKLIAEYDRL